MLPPSHLYVALELLIQCLKLATYTPGWIENALRLVFAKSLMLWQARLFATLGIKVICKSATKVYEYRRQPKYERDLGGSNKMFALITLSCTLTLSPPLSTLRAFAFDFLVRLERLLAPVFEALVVLGSLLAALSTSGVAGRTTWLRLRAHS